MNKKRVILGIAFIVVAVIAYIGENTVLRMGSGALPQSIEANPVFQFVGRHWRMEDIVVLVIGIVFVMAGVS
jgi:hypothetical protein